MGGNAEKTKFSIRVDTDLVELADTYIRSSTVKNRTELIEDALRFYLGFLTAQKAEDYLCRTVKTDWLEWILKLRWSCPSCRR